MSGLASQMLADTDPVFWKTEDCIRAISGAVQASRVALADASGAVSVLDVAAPALLWSKFAHEQGASLVDWSPTGDLIASAGQDGYVKLWQPETGEVVRVLQAPGLWIEQLKWSPDGNYLAVGADKSLFVWDRDGKLQVHYDQHPSSVAALAWKRNSREVATACYKTVSVFRTGFNRPSQTLRCLGSLISLAWSPDGKSIAAGSQDRMLQYWRMGNNKTQHAEMKGYPEKVSSLAWDGSGRFLATAGGRDVVVWSTTGRSPAGTAPGVLRAHSARVTALSFQNDGKLLASGGSDGKVCIWDAAGTREAVMVDAVDSPITGVFWTNHGRTLVVGSEDGAVHLYAAGQSGTWARQPGAIDDEVHHA